MAAIRTQTNEVHKDSTGGKAGYGHDACDHFSNLVATAESITCA
jgi:hypothetical protein